MAEIMLRVTDKVSGGLTVQIIANNLAKISEIESNTCAQNFAVALSFWLKERLPDDKGVKKLCEIVGTSD